MEYVKKIRRYIGHSIALRGKAFRWISNEWYLKSIYYILLNERLNLDNPLSYTQKLQWLKVYDRNELYHQLVDKFEVRTFIEKKIGENYLIPLIGIYESVEDINWDELPNQFVLKATHTSGNVIICKDKNQLDLKSIRSEMKGWLMRDYFYYYREWPYKDLKPRIVCEEFLTELGSVPVDYKIMCFLGKPEIIQVHKGRFEDHVIEYYDTSWNKLKVWSEGYEMSNSISEKPSGLQDLLKIAEKLSEGLPQSRIDLYYVDGKIYFSEITFFDGAGFDKFYPDKFNNSLGDLINLEEIKK